MAFTKKKKKKNAERPAVTEQTKDLNEPSGELKVGGRSRAAPQRVRWCYKKKKKKRAAERPAVTTQTKDRQEWSRGLKIGRCSRGLCSVFLRGFVAKKQKRAAERPAVTSRPRIGRNGLGDSVAWLCSVFGGVTTTNKMGGRKTSRDQADEGPAGIVWRLKVGRGSRAALQRVWWRYKQTK